MTVRDPRHENCKAFKIDGNGKVVGVKLDYYPQPGTRYELISAKLLDEYEAKGNCITTVYLYDKAGRFAEDTVMLGYPWTGDLPIAHMDPPGNVKRPVEHVTESCYDPTETIGPLAILVTDANRRVISDVIGGLGLPGYINHATGEHGGAHVSFVLAFQERGAPQPDPDPEPEPEPEPDETPNATQVRTLQLLEALCVHLGLPLPA